jgi:flagellar hook-basal body complex protein FliE
MDGLTISNADTLLERGQTLKEIRNSNHAIPNPAASPSQPGEKTFADTLKDAVQSVNEAQKTADYKAQQLATGKSSDIADVMLSAEKANIQFKLMTSVRNKIIEAYQEIMKMQV